MKGQISLDFILTITIAFSAIVAVGIIGSEMVEIQKQSTVRQQLDTIGTELSKVISSSAVLLDGENATISYKIPGLLVPGENEPQPCNISINDIGEDVIEITLTYVIFDQETGVGIDIEVIKHATAPKMLLPGPGGGGAPDRAEMAFPSESQCGEILQFSKN